MKLHKPLSDRQYLDKYGGSVCPMCLSPRIGSGIVDSDGSTGTADCLCRSCGAHWKDMWEICGYCSLNEGMTKAELDAVLAKAKEIRNNPDALAKESEKDC